MKILQIKPKKILQWDFFTLPLNSEKNNLETTVSKINETDFFLEPLKCLELKGKYYLRWLSKMALFRKRKEL